MLEVDAFQDYLLYERSYSALTVKVYGSDVREFQDFVGNLQDEDLAGEDVDADLVRDWIVSLMEEGKSAATVNRKLSSLRAYFKFQLRRGELKVDPMQKVTGPKRRKPLPVYYREAEMDRVLDSIPYEESFEGCRDHLIMEMFYSTGMRRAELIGLNDTDIDPAASQLKVTGKRNKQRIIPFGEELKQAMEAYIGQRNDEVPQRCGAFFVQKSGGRLTPYVVTKIVKRYLSMVVTAKKRSPHLLRHTFATAMLNHGADLNTVKELLGHESLGTTQIYTHTTFEELKKMYNQAHPRA